MPLIFVIQGGAMWFRQSNTAFNPLTEQMLTKQSLKLQKHNLIERKDYKTAPLKVECCLIDFGRYFKPIISQFQQLDKKHKKKIVAVTAIE